MVAPTAASRAAKALISIRPAGSPSLGVIGGVEDAFGRAEFAGDADHAVVADHRRCAPRRKSSAASRRSRSAEQRQASASGVGRNTRTPRSLNRRNSSRSLDKRRVDQLVVLGRRGARLGLDPFVVLGRGVDGRPGGRVAGIEIDLAAALGRIGQELREQAARAPLRARRRHALADGEPNQRRDLLGALEIGVRGLLEALALERDRRPDSATGRRRDRW